VLSPLADYMNTRTKSPLFPIRQAKLYLSNVLLCEKFRNDYSVCKSTYKSQSRGRVFEKMPKVPTSDVGSIRREGGCLLYFLLV
jgi:hypothetical protein